jgi:hypothetical protein
MNRSRVGWLLITLGVFIPLASLPFAEGYHPNAGVIENVQLMTLQITSDRSEPSFEEVKQGYINPNWPFIDISPASESPPPVATGGSRYAVLVDPDPGKIRLFFPNRQSDDEIRWALKAGRKQIESSTSKYLAYYYGKLAHKGLRLPFAYVLSGALFISFLGVIFLIFSPKRTRQRE